MFTHRDIYNLGDLRDGAKYGFYSDLCGLPGFEDCENNHEVERRVIELIPTPATAEFDSESGGFAVYFRSYAAGVTFTKRLNQYIEGSVE